MNIFFWILQVILALHTVVGAGWKIFNSEQSIPSLNAIPHGVWMGLIGLELVCAMALVVPIISPSFGYLVPLAALGIAFEMLVFSGVHIQAGSGQNSQMIYWLVVAAICAIIAFGRYFVAPL